MQTHLQTAEKPIEILLVEDEPGDAYLTSEALKSARIINRLHLVEDGVEALAFLHREGSYSDAPRPDLILLDLNLPRKDGRQVLAEIKNDPLLNSIPTVVLTTSSADEDVLQSYNLRANCYITKPVDLEQFMSVIKATQEFWLSIVKLPRPPA
ncbi:MAG: response regulator [Verrucomicrobia bacterium]|nr:response regulator [Verrucomicrobiota bacterium]